MHAHDIHIPPKKSAHQTMTTPTILVINKVDCAPIDSIGPLEETCSGFFKKVVQTCGISELEKAVLEVRGLDPISSGGRKWTVNQSKICPEHRSAHGWLHWSSLSQTPACCEFVPESYVRKDEAYGVHMNGYVEIDSEIRSLSLSALLRQLYTDALIRSLNLVLLQARVGRMVEGLDLN
ncbi:putative tRNA modification GTPase MnmE-like protein [Carex littledalei]|uniref:Putative tRNA modification GTPase MnmE-like protein n=1 Tax=Carex littledalei TaxID=544730 RepID=A0A833VGJ4_9POAL|nr:putative tRNA modification GTPase MnmE-like protein [Carex littledalei]